MSALVCLTYDDALPVHCEVVAPLLAERGLRGTFYIPAARDDFHNHLEDWRKVAAMGHELGNHSCFHPCRTRADWDWKPPYRLEEYTRERIRDELQLANRILQLVDGRSQRSYGATCGDLTVGDDESFVDDIRDLFAVVRAGQTEHPLTGAMPFVSPALFVDFRRADEVIPVIEAMRGQNNAWLIIGMHGVGAGTHNNFMEADEHRRLVDWIASQDDWLEAVTVLEAAHQFQKAGDTHG
jgi:sialate O-acetylesterase